MTIEKTITGTAAALKIIGRLDTTTAPELRPPLTPAPQVSLTWCWTAPHWSTFLPPACA
mgnify:CR=1 FL=1